MRSIAALLRQWDWSLFLLILLYIGLPQIYRSYSVYLIGNAIPDTSALATVAQWQFVELMLEVIQETFVLAMFFFVGQAIYKNEKPGYPIRTALSLILLFSSMVAVILFFLSGSFVEVIGTPQSMQATTVSFLKIKSAGIPLILLSTALVITVETVNRKRLILITAILQVVYRFIFDSLFYGGHSFSLDLGVLGVAWSDLAASLALLITIFTLLRPLIMEGVDTWSSFFSIRGWRIYARVSTGSGIDSLVRNLAYFYMIVRMVNLLGEGAIGGYYLAMHIFWTMLLVPILALSESAKVLIANHCGDLSKVRKLWFSSLAIGAIFILLWVVFLPFWHRVATLLNPDVELVDYSMKALAILLVPYMLLALNLVTDSIFYGLGRTEFMAYQAIITNGTVYVGAYIAYVTGFWTPTFNSILFKNWYIRIMKF